MNDSRRRATWWVSILSSLAAALACEGTMEPPRRDDLPSLRVYADMAASTASALSVEISAPDISPSLHFNLPVGNGTAVGTIQVPAGANRTFTLRAFDISGIETHRGTRTVHIVNGANPPLTMTLSPLLGDQEIDVTVGSVIVVVAPSVDTIPVAGTTQLGASVLDSDGEQAEVQTVYWASLAPTIATVDGRGLVTGRRAGVAQVVATYGLVGGSALVHVIAGIGSVEIQPATATAQTGTTQQFSATVRDASGAVVPGASVTWRSLAPTVAIVGPSGLATALLPGTARIEAASEGVADTAVLTVVAAPPPPPGGTADPTLLPAATGQRPAQGSYGRQLQAGQTYTDPNSGVTVLKLTDAQTPVANGGMYHGYSEGGPNISQPWTGTDGETYYTVKVDGWLVDIRYRTLTPTNWRRVNYDGEVGFAFSLDPATPRIAYVVNGKRVDRYNTATNQVENIGHWPWNIAATGTSPQWLQTQLNDTWLVVMLQSNTSVVAFRPADGFERVITRAAANLSEIDEPHLDREQPVVYLSGDPVHNKIVDLNTGAMINPVDPNGLNGDDHAAPLRGQIVAISWMANGIIAVDYRGTLRVAVTPSPTDWSGDWHMAGQWVFDNPQNYFVIDQWLDTGNYPIYRGMIGFVSTAGDLRLIAAHDGVGSGYDTGGQPHPTLSPDGKFVMWTSNMNGSGRFDTFLARIPTR